jgi:acyl carrier protein
MGSTRETLTAFIKESFLPGLPGVQLDDTTSFLDSGFIDSTGVLELVDFLEESFGIEVEDSELVPENLDSINNLERYLKSKGVASTAE